MKTREVTIASGQKFIVPQGIQRIDTGSTHGWQVRYQGTKYFKDGHADLAAPDKALEQAKKELFRRIAELPAPVRLRQAPLAHKSSDLPPGISGPIVLSRRGKETKWAVLSVLLPRHGKKNGLKNVYIGTEGTYTKTRFRAALAKAVAMREQVTREYEAAATKAKRREAVSTRQALKSTASAA